ncbi:MAG: cell division protein FtsL [Gammaproteobacteria bacterium]|nr:cell division protein FtsL [Gammaproteobacteria bacterium]
MNTRTIDQADMAYGNILGSNVLGGLLAGSPVRVIFLGLAVFLSCIAVVYVKDINRRLSVQSQMITAQEGMLKVEGDKLLLEQSAWSMQARIERIATTDLNMQLPSSNAVVMVRG